MTLHSATATTSRPFAPIKGPISRPPFAQVRHPHHPHHRHAAQTRHCCESLLTVTVKPKFPLETLRCRPLLVVFALQQT